MSNSDAPDMKLGIVNVMYWGKWHLIDISRWYIQDCPRCQKLMPTTNQSTNMCFEYKDISSSYISKGLRIYKYIKININITNMYVCVAWKMNKIYLFKKQYIHTTFMCRERNILSLLKRLWFPISLLIFVRIKQWI